MTLDGVPSPPGYMSDQEEDMCSEGMRPAQHPAASHGGLAGLLHPQRSRVLSRQLEDPDGSFANGVWGLSLPSQGAGVMKDVFAVLSLPRMNIGWRSFNYNLVVAFILLQTK